MLQALIFFISHPGPLGYGPVPRSGSFLREGRTMGPGVGHVPPGESCHVWRTGGHRSFGTVLSAATSSYTARHGAGGTVRHLFSFLLLSLTSQGGFIFWCVCVVGRIMQETG